MQTHTLGLVKIEQRMGIKNESGAYATAQISTINIATRCSFLTIPNTFKQCTISLLTIHSAICWDFKEKPLGC